MTLRDIKLEALKLMGVDTIAETDESLDSIATDDNYKDYMAGMAGAINRAYSRIESKETLPVKTHMLDEPQAVASGLYSRYDLSAIADLDKVERVTYDDGDRYYNGNCDFQFEGDTLILNRIHKGKYIVLYRPRIPRVLSTTSNETELSFPDKIAVLIPYFIVGDLFRGDELRDANEMRNYFEAGLDEIQEQQVNKQGRVDITYNFMEM